MRSAMTPAPYVVVERTEEVPEVCTLTLRPSGQTIGNSPMHGQFNMLYAFGVGEAAISVSEILDNNDIKHTIRQHGATSRALFKAETGQSIGVRGPFGVGWTPPLNHEDVVIVTGGIGIAPLRSLIQMLAADDIADRKVAVVYGGRSPEVLLYQAEFKEWQRLSNFTVLQTVDAAPQDWTGSVGLVTNLLTKLDLTPDNPIRAYICGPEIMMRHTAEALVELGVSSSHIELSLERNMKCAIGHCGHCQFGSAFICKDGPVFSFDRIRDRLFVREL